MNPTRKKAAPRATTDPMTRELAAVKAMKATATKAAAKPGEVGRCRGRWSKCGGKEPSLSASWHLGARCTKAYREMKKAEAASKPKAAKPAPRSAGSSPKTAGVAKARVPKNSGGVPRAAKAPAPEHVAHPRVPAPVQGGTYVQLVSPE